MALDRHGTGLAVLRIAIGTFFLFEGLGKVRWIVNASILAGQLEGWLRATPSGSLSHLYLQRVAIPFVALFARLVPAGEIVSGAALLVGFWTPLFAFIAFFMALNFQFASGSLFTYGALTSGYVLPVLGSTLALTLGGVRLPWSIRGAGFSRSTRAPRS